MDFSFLVEFDRSWNPITGFSFTAVDASAFVWRPVLLMCRHQSSVSSFLSSINQSFFSSSNEMNIVVVERAEHVLLHMGVIRIDDVPQEEIAILISAIRFTWDAIQLSLL